MSYSIWPRELARVSRETAAERDELQDRLRQLDPLLDQAAQGARPSAPVTAELDHFLAEHDAAARQTLARIDSALAHGELAVAAYVRGDVEMAEQYGRAAVVLDGSRPLPPPPAGPAAAPPAPEIVSGG